MMDESHHFPLYCTDNPVSISVFDYDKLSALEVQAMALLDSFSMIKVREL